MPTSPGHTTQPLHVIATQYEDPLAYVLLLHGATDQDPDDTLTDAFTAAATTGRHLIVDLAGLTHGDETLLALLLTAYRNTGITLVGPLPDAFTRRLATTGTQAFFPPCPNLTTALHHLTP